MSILRSISADPMVASQCRRIALVPAVAAMLIAGCSAEVYEAGVETVDNAHEMAVASSNGLSAINGLASANTAAGAEGLMSTPEGRNTVTYLVRCALPAGHSITKQDQDGNSYKFSGSLGFGPDWEYGACDGYCQRYVSGCMMAHVNTAGVHIPIWIDSDPEMHGAGWGTNPAYPTQEGSFMGNLFTSPPIAYYCHGRDWDKSVVPGRLGANQGDTPYQQIPGAPDLCQDFCTPSDSYTNGEPDGYKACWGNNQVITVWRAAEGSTSVSSTATTTGAAGSTGSGGYWRHR